MNAIIQTLMSQLETRNPQGYRMINQAMMSNGNPNELMKQMLGNASPEQIQDILVKAKNFGCPDNILSQIQNLKR